MAVATGLILILGVLVATLSRVEDRYLGSNSRVRASQHAVVVPPNRTRCQQEDVPAETTRLRLFAQTEGLAGPLRVRIRRGARTVATGTVRRLNGRQTVSLFVDPPVRQDVFGAALCLENDGPRYIALAGDRTLLQVGQDPPPVPPDEEPRVDYFADGSSSWWTRVSAVADRNGLLKVSFFGSWTLWAVLAGVLAASGLGLSILVRELRS